MRIRILIGVVVLQLLVLAYMAGEREWIVRYGTVVRLQTAPLDPRDPFRGNYVRLDYAINHVSASLLRGTLTNACAAGRAPKLQDKPLYAVLQSADDCITGLEYVTDRKPATGLFLRGKVERYWYSGQGVIPLQYGIEAYFVQEDKAKALEERRRRDGIQVPLEMDVAVSRRGVAVLKGHRWSPLGIGLQLDTVTLSNRTTQLRKATVQLVNVSSNDLAVVDLPAARSLVLENDAFRSWSSGRDLSWVMAGKPRAAVTDADVVVLKPGEQRQITVDLDLPSWFVTNGSTPAQPLRDLPSGSMFRLIYRPPSRAECRTLTQAALIWHGELPSTAFFSGGGRVD
jgi:uncharacterized membrane-anchored protein